MRIRNTLLLFVVYGCISISIPAAADETPADIPYMDRAAQIAGRLTDRPCGVGVPAADRTTWDRLAADPDWKQIVPAAEKYLNEPMPTLKDALYLEFTQNGNRTAYEKDYFQLEARFNTLVLAECLENKGRFLQLIETYLDQYITCRSWVYPAHDGSLDTFNGKRQIIDLGSSRMSFNLATAYDLLGDKLKPDTREKLRQAIFTRVLTPMKQQLTGEQKKEWWFTTTNNWNAVCMANVTGAAVTLVEDKNERAFYIAAAEHYIGHFLDGFNADGYCTEGPGYWNYGYGRFITLCKTVEQATGGYVDLFDSKKARRPATFGWDIQLAPGVAPAFADCSINTRPSDLILEYTGRRLDAPKRYRTSRVVSPTQELFITMLYDLEEPGDTIGELPEPTLPVRTWFDETGVLICRPATGSPCRLAAAFKGGHNAEHHNHNDLGSFVVTVDGRPLLLDPGSEVYTKFTFSGKRYESDAANSFGHPVPVIDGQLQKTGSAAKAEIVGTAFTDTTDRLTLDLTKGYDVKSLQQLTRQFVYSREHTGAVTVIDTVTFQEPAGYETALITYGNVRQLDGGSLLITDGKASVKVIIDTDDGPFTVSSEPLTANFRAGKPTRIAIKLDNPVKTASLTIGIVPEDLNNSEN
jgi:hypothetical protein